MMIAFEQQLDPNIVLHTLGNVQPRQSVYMEVTRRIVHHIVMFDTLQPMLNYVVKALQEELDFYITSIFNYDHQQQCALLVAQDGQSNMPAPIGYQQSIECGLLGKTLREGVTMLVDDVRTLPDYVSPQGYEPACAELCVPIYANDVLWGAFNVESTISNAFTYHDQLALELIAAQLGSAIYNLELHHHQQQMLTEISAHAEQQQLLLDEITQLSTPIFPVHPGVLALPLVGTLNEQRMQHVLATLLHEIHTTQSAAIILDVTGIATLDRQAAQLLSNVVASCKLLGTHAVVTGIRPEVAMMLVTQQTTPKSFVVKQDFASGLQYALHLCGKSIQRVATN